MSQIIESEKQTTAVNPETIQCVWCGKRSHVIKVHLDKGECESVPEKFANLTPSEQFVQYKAQNPDAPTISKLALKTLEERRIASETANKEPVATMNYAKPEYKIEKMEAHTLFGIPLSKLCRANGAPLMVSVNTNTPFPDLVPKKKEGYVFGDPELLKDVIMMLEMGIPGFIWGHMGTGKAQPVDTIIPTPNGMRRFGDLKPGDLVFGANGKPTSVVGVYPQGVKPVYRVGFRDHTSTLACGEHLWHIKPNHKTKKKNGKVYIQHPKVLSTQDMIDRGYLNAAGASKFQVPVCDAVEWPERKHFIHPYNLGLMIGDGSMLGNTPVFSFGASDVDVFERFESYLPEGLKIGCVRETSENGRQVTIIDQNLYHGNRFMDECRRLKLNVHSGEKHIPEEYLIDSVENRLSLLRGLMDSDGTARNNRIGFSTTSPKLASGIQSLVQSLGGIAIIKDRDEPRYKSGYYAEINIKTKFNPFSSTRKSSSWREPRKSPPSRYITSIVSEGETECMCIKVSADDSLYLTENFIVTHNTTIVAQVCAHLNRPMIRSQHTASTEESHIVGQILAKEGSTYFEPGLLSLAMRLGWVYLADEYDFAYPQILGIYQPVLEGEPLTLKEATPEWRTVEPHDKFAFVGTGNTNGSGDETGLYQGTNIQNAANFSRFGIVTEAKYMDSRHEVEMIMNLGIEKSVASNLVSFAKSIRDSFTAGKISQPIGPRELTLAAIVGSARSDLKLGIEKAFINKLPSVSAQVAREIAQRYFA